MAQPTPNAAPVPMWILVGTLVACGITAMFVVPSSRAWLERSAQQAEENPRAALSALRSTPARTRAEDPGGYALLESHLETRMLGLEYYTLLDNHVRTGLVDSVSFDRLRNHLEVEKRALDIERRKSEKEKRALTQEKRGTNYRQVVLEELLQGLKAGKRTGWPDDLVAAVRPDFFRALNRSEREALTPDFLAKVRQQFLRILGGWRTNTTARKFVQTSLGWLASAKPRDPVFSAATNFFGGLPPATQLALYDALATVTWSEEGTNMFYVARPFAASLPTGARRALFDVLAGKIATAGKAGGLDWKAAGDLFRELWHENRELADAGSKMVQCWQWATNQVQALEALEEWEKSQQKSLATLSPDLARVHVELLVLQSRPMEAFDAAVQLYSSADREQRPDLRKLVLQTALLADRTGDVLAVAREEAENNRTNLLAWRTLARAYTAGTNLDEAAKVWEEIAKLEPASTNYFHLGQFHEWSGRPMQAFDSYLQAFEHTSFRPENPVLGLGSLAPGELEHAASIGRSLDRLLALNPSLYRDTDLADAMFRHQDIVATKHRTRELCHLLTSVGEFEKAASVYGNLLASQGNTAPVLVEFGRLRLDLYQYEAALELFGRAVALDPQDPEAWRGVVDSLYHLYRYEETLTAYERLADLAPTEQMLEDYCALAESMGRVEKVTAGLRLKMQLVKQPKARDYLRLAYYYTLLGNTEEARRVLVEAEGSGVNDPTLALKAAYALRDARQPLEAARILARHPQLRSNEEIGSFYIRCLVQGQALREAAAFMLSDLSAAVTNSSPFLDASANVFEQYRLFERALANYKALVAREPDSVGLNLNVARMLSALERHEEAEAKLAIWLGPRRPKDPTLAYSLAALVYAAGGKLRLAQDYQARVLALKKPPGYLDWGFAADLLLQRGDRTGAKQGYHRALSELMRAAEKERAEMYGFGAR